MSDIYETATPKCRPRHALRRRSVSMALALTVLTSLVACGGVDASGGDGTIRIGVVAPATGANAEQGQNTRNAVELAVDEINDAGGVDGASIEAVFEDSQSSNSGAIAAFSKLAASGDLAGVIAPFYSTQVNAMLPAINQTQIPVITGATDPTLTSENNTWLFRTRPDDDLAAQAFAQYGTGELGVNKWGIIHTTDAFGTAASQRVRDALEAAGAQVVSQEGYTNGAQDFTASILAYKATDAGGLIVLCSFPQDCGILGRQLNQQQVDAEILGSASMGTPSALELGAEGLWNTYVISDFAADANPTAKMFTEAYRQRFGTEPDIASSYAYDGMNILADAMRTAGTTDPQAVREAILDITGLELSEGMYDFDPTGDGLDGYNVLKNNAGELVFVTRLTFATDHG